MTTRRKWVLGSVGLMLVVLAVAAFQFETQVAMGKVTLPWQKTRRRMIAARRMFGSMTGSRFVKFRVNETEEEAAAEEARMQKLCTGLAEGAANYVVRCTEVQGAERERVRAEMLDLTKGMRDITGCGGPGSGVGPSDADVAPCLKFLASGTCDILDYGENELALGELDLMVKKPTRPQPHLEACPFLFGL